MMLATLSVTMTREQKREEQEKEMKTLTEMMRNKQQQRKKSVGPTISRRMYELFTSRDYTTLDDDDEDEEHHTQATTDQQQQQQQQQEQQLTSFEMDARNTLSLVTTAEPQVSCHYSRISAGIQWHLAIQLGSSGSLYASV